MTVAIDSIVNISITRATATPTRQSLTNPMIMGCANRFPELARTYTALSGMLSDGFLATDPEYLTASAIKAQSPSLKLWKVGRRSTRLPDETINLAVSTSINTGSTVDFFVNGSEVKVTATSSSTSAFATLIAIGVTAACTTVAASASGGVVTVTPTVSKARTRITTWGNLQGGQQLMSYQDNTLATSADIASDFSAIQAYDGDWYGLLMACQSTLEVQGAAAWAETADPKVLLVFDQCDDICRTSNTSDVFSLLKGHNYNKSMGLYNGNDNQAHSSAAWMGLVFAMGNPGAVNWNFRQPTGPVADNLTATDITNLIGKRANYLVNIAGLTCAQGGAHVASNEYADVIYGLDALTLDMATRIFTDLANNPKIPYTDTGMDVIRGDIRAAISKFSGPNYLLLVPGSANVEIPLVATVSSADKGSRTVNNIVWQAQLQGAVNAVNINGTVTL